MAKCAKCGKEIPNTPESINWRLYCKDCGFPEILKEVQCIGKDK